MEDKELLSREEVMEVLQMANAIYSPPVMDGYGVYNPYLLNQNLVDLNNDSKVPTYEKIIEAFENIKDNDEVLQSYSEWLQWTESIYAKTIYYLENILSFDLDYCCVSDNVDYGSDKYKKDVNIVNKWLRSFNYKKYFKQMTREMLRSNIVFTWLRDNNNEEYPQRALQILPQKYCLVTGNSSVCPTFDFDMTYFTKAGTSIDLYPEVFKRYWKDVYSDNGMKRYTPSNRNRNGTYVLYHQTSINDGAFCFMFNDGNFNTIPPLTFMMRSSVLNPEIEELQRNKDIASAYALLVGELRIFDGAKSGEKPNQWAISPTMVGSFLSKVQRGLRKNIRPVAMPTEETKFMQYNDQNPLMSSYKYAESASQGVSANSMIYTTGKASMEESRNQITTDGNLMKNLYRQFETFLNYYVNKKTRNYKFEFHFSGIDYWFDRKERIDQAFKFADKGFVLNPTYYASCLGIEPYNFMARLKEGHDGELTKLLTPLINLNTMGNSGIGSNQSKPEKIGRPEEDSNDLGQAGVTSRDYGSYK